MVNERVMEKLAILAMLQNMMFHAHLVKVRERTKTKA